MTSPDQCAEKVLSNNPGLVDFIHQASDIFELFSRQIEVRPLRKAFGLTHNGSIVLCTLLMVATVVATMNTAVSLFL